MASGWLLVWPFMGREARFLFQVGCFALKGNGGPWSLRASAKPSGRTRPERKHVLGATRLLLVSINEPRLCCVCTKPGRWETLPLCTAACTEAKGGGRVHEAGL